MRDKKGRFIKGGHYNPLRENFNIVKCNCGKEFKQRLSRIKQGKEKYCSRECSDKFRAKVVWNKNKFDLNTYYGLHNWVKRNRGKATKCEFCGSHHMVQWANKSHQYLHDLSDWIELCKSCHNKYDSGENKGSWRRIYG